MANRVFSPWLPTEVINLKKRQRAGHLHPYTCGDCGAILEATQFGWVCPTTHCAYMQNWAYQEDVEGKNV